MFDVSIISCEKYDNHLVKNALSEAINAIDGFSWLRDGMTVAIKANLLGAKTPDQAATTHPSVLKGLAELLIEKGAGKVVIGDCPGAPFTAVVLNRIYNATGVNDIVNDRIVSNNNFSSTEVKYDNAKVLHSFLCANWLLEADAVIDACKFKTHGLMGITAASKNLYGIIPGTTKSEYHYLHPDMGDFSNLIVDLDEFISPVLSICDAVVGMEGNGPNNGSPRQIGAIIASLNPHKLDLLAASLIGLGINDVPTLSAAYERELIPGSVEGLTVCGNPSLYALADYDKIKVSNTYIYSSVAKGFKNKLISHTLETLFRPKPALTGNCIACSQCVKSCPANAIVIINGKASINRKKCIRCFCCQEFCPAGALGVQRTLISKIINR